ncbi:MAG: hypothetical protein CMF59_09455 [Leptospiraceae bacterium]|nr:hypothetical protein [Leptospiraceae bacterium]
MYPAVQMTIFVLLGGAHLAFYFWSLLWLPERVLSSEELGQLRQGRLGIGSKKSWLFHIYELASILIFALIMIISFGLPLYLQKDLPDMGNTTVAVSGFTNLFYLMNLYNGTLEVFFLLHSNYGLIIKRFHSQGYYRSPVARRIGLWRWGLSTLVWGLSMILNYALVSVSY